MKRWLFWIGILISALLIFFSIRGLQLKEVWEGIRSAKLIWIIPGLIVYFLAVWLRALRWQYLLRPTTSIPVKQIFPVVAIGYMGNNIYPARAGELLRSVVLKHKFQTPIPASLATIVVERIFDGVVMLTFIILNLSVVTNLVGMAEFSLTIQRVTLWVSAVFLGTLILFIMAAIHSEKAQKLINNVAGKIIPKKWRDGFQAIMKKVFYGLQSLSSLSDVLIILIISFAIWLLETGLYWFIMLAFSFRVNFSTLLFLNGVLNLLTIIPSSPGYIGVFDAPSIALLSTVGVNTEAAASYTLLLHAVLWLPITIVGGIYFGKVGLNWSKEMDQAKAEKNA